MDLPSNRMGQSRLHSAGAQPSRAARGGKMRALAVPWAALSRKRAGRRRDPEAGIAERAGIFAVGIRLMPFTCRGAVLLLGCGCPLDP